MTHLKRNAPISKNKRREKQKAFEKVFFTSNSKFIFRNVIGAPKSGDGRRRLGWPIIHLKSNPPDVDGDSPLTSKSSSHTFLPLFSPLPFPNSSKNLHLYPASPS